ncbi:hypothetical protein BC826DRAFT_967498 [Russula brevipes]|nr:hypothetical protein BC826DRAFT_967498 [Russula brevipes]
MSSARARGRVHVMKDVRGIMGYERADCRGTRVEYGWHHDHDRSYAAQAIPSQAACNIRCRRTTAQYTVMISISNHISTSTIRAHQSDHSAFAGYANKLVELRGRGRDWTARASPPSASAAWARAISGPPSSDSGSGAGSGAGLPARGRRTSTGGTKSSPGTRATFREGNGARSTRVGEEPPSGSLLGTGRGRTSPPFGSDGRVSVSSNSPLSTAWVIVDRFIWWRYKHKGRRRRQGRLDSQPEKKTGFHIDLKTWGTMQLVFWYAPDRHLLGNQDDVASRFDSWHFRVSLAPKDPNDVGSGKGP